MSNINEKVKKVTEALSKLNDPYSSDSLITSQSNIIKELPGILEALNDAVTTLHYISMGDVDEEDPYSLDYYQSYGRMSRIIENLKKQSTECLNRINK